MIDAHVIEENIFAYYRVLTCSLGGQFSEGERLGFKTVATADLFAWTGAGQQDNQ